MTNSSLFNAAFLWWLLFAVPCTGQETKIEEISFFDADSAEVVDAEEGVRIIASNVKGAGVGVRITVPFSADYADVAEMVVIQGIELFKWPERVEPSKANDELTSFDIVGQPGLWYGVEINGGKGGLLKVQIPGKPQPPEPDKPKPGEGPTEADLQSIRDISLRAANTLGDSITQQAIRAKLAAIEWPDNLTAATEEVQKAIRDALLETMRIMPAPYKDWYGQFREPINQKIVSLESSGRVSNVDSLKQIVQAIVSGLSGAQQSVLAKKNGTIEMLVRPGCAACKNWESSIWPELEKQGWKLVKRQVDPMSTEQTPTFMICDAGRCIIERGYMSKKRFTELIELNKAQ